MLGRFGAYSTYGTAVAYPLAAPRRTCPCSRAPYRGIPLLNVEIEMHLPLPHSRPAALQLPWARPGSVVHLAMELT
jgi:hypothetical protein